MTPEQWHHVEALFEAALERPREGRADWLAAACEDAALRDEVLAMLGASERDGPFLEAPVGVAAAALVADVVADAEPDEDDLGRRVGPYRLVEVLGHGGMGAVYLAERADGQFEQRVAVKLLRRDIHTEAFRGRFLAERQILASLDHPHIARLLDGGVTENGRPYYAMEHVAGRPLTRYCDEERLSVRDRLRLFTTVGRAVAYAHQNLVVHRDLKPSNILVSEDAEGEPQVKLLDFGIAKLLGEPVRPDLPVTRTGLRLMTPEYAAPEQVRGEPISTATDVYQLGVVLFELLAGHRPFALEGRTPAEVERLVCETQPERPSTLVAVPPPDGDADPAAVAAARRASPERLRKALHGDLDRIVLKALRKEPARRYASAAELVADVERFLGGRPVSARPDSLGYRVQTFVRRNRWGVAAAAAFLVLLLGYAVTVSVQQARTAAERDRAEQEAAEAEAVSAFLLALLVEGDPQADEPRQTAAIQGLLRAAQDRLEGAFTDQPRVRAELYAILGWTHVRALMLQEAEPLLQRALAEYRTLGGSDGLWLEDVTFRLGDLYRNQGRLDSAAVYYRATIEHAERAGRADGYQAWAYLWLATFAESGSDRQRRLYEAALRTSEAAIAVDAVQGLRTTHRAADAEGRRNAYRTARLRLLFADKGGLSDGEALALARAVQEEAEGEGWEELAAYALFIAGRLVGRADPEQAVPIVEAARQRTAAALGPEHDRYGLMTLELASLHLRLGQHAEALVFAEDALALCRALYGDVPNLREAEVLTVLGRVQHDAGRAAEPTLARAVAVYEALGVSDADPRLIEARRYLQETQGGGVAAP